MNTNEMVEKIIGGYRIKRNDNSLIEHLKNVILTDEQFSRLYKAGVRRYHNNIETSRSYFKIICIQRIFHPEFL